MSKFELKGYSIESQKVYDVIKKYDKLSDAALKKLDKNSDKNISEDELVELSDIDETDTVDKTKNPSKEYER